MQELRRGSPPPSSQSAPCVTASAAGVCPGRIIIDACEACHLIWLDPGELDRVIDAPGRDRGSSLLGGEGAWRDRDERGARDDDDDERRRRPGSRSSRRIDLVDLLFGD